MLGSNLGDRAALLAAAREQLALAAGELMASSALYETAAWGREDQPAFLNQALAVRTTLTPHELLAHCLATEQRAGRQRLERWGSRTLDVDILLYGPEIIDAPTLTVPHPRLAERRFALVPLAEIAGSVLHPVRHTSIAELLAICPDPLAVKPWPGR
nr:2-amino-4-hydroxy-6-hydroxymethyldihydropteridine diphosphokinase [Hymenobacter sp. BT523]